MQELAFALQWVSLSAFIIFAAMAIAKQTRDDQRITESKSKLARIDLALRRTGTHPGNRVKQAQAIIGERNANA